MIGYTICRLLSFLILTSLLDPIFSRPAVDSEDFHIDDGISLTEEGSAGQPDLPTETRGVRLIGSGDGSDEVESGSASQDEDHDEEDAVPVYTTTGSEPTTREPGDSLTTPQNRSVTPSLSPIPPSTTRRTIHYNVSAEQTTEVLSSTISALPSSTEEDQQETGSSSGDQVSESDDEDSEIGSAVIPSTTHEPQPSTTPLSEDEGSAGEDDFLIDPVVHNITTISGSGILIDDTHDRSRLSSSPPPFSDSPTLPGDVALTEELLPVTTKHSPVTSEVQTTETTEEVTNILETIPPPKVIVTLGKAIPSTLLETGTTIDTLLTIPTYSLSPSENGNVSRKIEGRRRRPHPDVTDKTLSDGAPVGASSEDSDKKEPKRVSYFAVIAAALISALVFFALGYLTSRCRSRGCPVTLPWRKEKANMEIPAESGNGSAVQVYRDINPDPVPTAYHEIDSRKNDKNPVNGSKNEAEIHLKPNELTATGTVHVPHADPENDGSVENAPEEIKYIDETDEELEPPASTPLLDDTTTAERDDLASQVLDTVDKKLNSDEEKDGLLSESNKR